MISYFFKNVKLNREYFENLTDFSSQTNYIQSLMPTLNDLHSCKCPKCGAIDRFSHHCNYMRNLSFCINDQIVNFKISVTRVICNSCNSTHAILPDFITPYKIMASFSICDIVKFAFSSSVLTVQKKLNISYQLIYHYISLFLSFLPNIAILNNFNSYSPDFYGFSFILDFDFYDYNFFYDYISFFKWCFLMDKFRNSTYNIIYIGVAQSRST